MPKYGAGHSEPFGQMVRRTQPTVALTGTFFCTQSKLPVGDIVIDGQLEHFGGLGTAMCITDNNEVEFVKTERYKHQDWSKYDFVISCGPRLLTDGKLTVYPKAEGFKDRHMLRPNSRLAVGVTKANKLVFVTTRKPVILSKMAKAMKAIGVHNALNLDAGSSLGVHYKGKTLIKPGRWLTNLILVYNDKNRYYDRLQTLAPGKQLASKVTVPALPAPTTSGDASHLTIPMPAFPVQKPQQP
jgi:exopolysaccharide biosynthesis protein